MKSVFAIAAHPDDIEFLMAGTLLLLGRAGYEMHYMNIANGCCGSTQTDRETTARIRREEARAACDQVGAIFHESIAADLEIFYDRPTLARVASEIRDASPEIVLTHSPTDYMEDHTNACRLAVTAAFARGMPNFPVEPPRSHVESEVTVYHAQPYGNRNPLRQVVRPELFVDIASVHEEKTAMLARHKSQKEWLDESQGLDSYLLAMKRLDEEVGQMSGTYQLAEGWRRHLHLGFCSEEADPLAAALEEVCMVAS